MHSPHEEASLPLFSADLNLRWWQLTNIDLDAFSHQLLRRNGIAHQLPTSNNDFKTMTSKCHSIGSPKLK